MRKVGALALTFTLLMTLVGIVPISAKRESVELSKAPFLEGDKYYYLDWYFENGELDSDDNVRIVTSTPIDENGYGGSVVGFMEYYAEWESVDVSGNGDYEDRFVERWSGMGLCYLAKMDITVKASELLKTLQDSTNQSEGDTFNEFGWCYFEGDIKLYKIIDTPDSIGDLASEMFGSFGNTVGGFTNGIKGMFNSLLWKDGTSDSGLSHFARFGFVMAGLSLALGLGYFIIRKIRG